MSGYDCKSEFGCGSHALCNALADCVHDGSITEASPVACCGKPDVCADQACAYPRAHKEAQDEWLPPDLIPSPPASVEPAGEFSQEMHTMPSNPKQFYGDAKVPLHLFPNTAIAGGAMAFLEGMLKYGDNNFRAAPVEAMTYVRAAESHGKAWAEGENIDPASGLPHLFKWLACVAILIDATYAGSLIDNRKYPGGYHKLVAEMEPYVQRLREMHADKSPKHYTIADAP